MSQVDPEAPSMVPYVEWHTGPRRVLRLRIEPKGRSRNTPVVSIDGRRYVTYWGSVSFELPADRPCHVSVHLESEWLTQAASVLLPPGPDVELRYRPTSSGHGTLGA